MTAAVVVAAVLAVAAALLALSLLRSRADASAARRDAADAQSRVNELQAESAQTQSDLASTRERVAELEAAATARTSLSTSDEAHIATDGASTVALDVPTLSALWALTRIRQAWTNRQSAILSQEEEPAEGRWAQATLAEVLDEEVSRIREDTGTPGTLRTSLPHEPTPAQSVLLMTSLQALLDALSRHCQGYDLYVHEWERRLTAIIVCDGFDGPDRVAADATSVLAAIEPAGGELALDRDAKGRLRARISLAAALA